MTTTHEPVAHVPPDAFAQYHTYVLAHARDPTYAARVRAEHATCTPERRAALDALVRGVWAVNRVRYTLTRRMLARALACGAATAPILQALSSSSGLRVVVDPAGRVGRCAVTGETACAFRWHLHVGDQDACDSSADSATTSMRSECTWSVRSDVGEVLRNYHLLHWYLPYHTAWWSGPAADPDAYATFQYLCRTVACTTRSR